MHNFRTRLDLEKHFIAAQIVISEANKKVK